MRDRYTLFVGLLFAAVIALALISGVGDEEGGGTLGLDRQPPHWPLPEFAVPLAAGGLEGDANVAQDDCATSQVPCPPDARRTPACGVADPEAVRVCDLFDRPSVISFWFDRGDCVAEQDAFDRAYRRYGGRVAFLSIDVRDSRDVVRGLIREHGWRVPVGYDRDGAVAALYRVGGCPTFAFAYPGGTLQSAAIGRLGFEGIARRTEALLEATRAAEASTRTASPFRPARNGK